jgi:hypothetical protein
VTLDLVPHLAERIARAKAVDLHERIMEGERCIMMGIQSTGMEARNQPARVLAVRASLARIIENIDVLRNAVGLLEEHLEDACTPQPAEVNAPPKPIEVPQNLPALSSLAAQVDGLAISVATVADRINFLRGRLQI